MSTVALEFTKVWKKFNRGEKLNTLRDLIPSFTKTIFSGSRREDLHDREFWALQDVSFEVKRGEALGIIGSNGAGKSTILKLLSGLLRPNKGRIGVNGRLSALIEVGAGFHPELTGRENIYLSGAILGMKKSEIDAKFNEIVEFSGVADFIDTPVKRFSSGMYARLGFSVAAHIDPDILLVDEVLSVGDTPFQKKCLMKMNQLVKDEKTIIFVSHNLDAVRDICPQTLLLEKGQTVVKGNSIEVIDSYLSKVLPVAISSFQNTIPHNEDMFIEYVSALDEQGNARNEFCQGEKIRISIKYRAKNIDPMVGVAFFKEDGLYIYGTNTDVDGISLKKGNDSANIELVIKNINLLRGTYFITIALRDSSGIVTYHILEKCLTFRIKDIRLDQGLFYLDHFWKADSQMDEKK